MLLSIEFLSALASSNFGVSFRMFNHDHTLSWKHLSVVLGFDKNCSLNLQHATPNFNQDEFWESLTSLDSFALPKPIIINNPTLCFLQCWLNMTLFPRDDMSSVRIEELRLLYAMDHKIRVSPIKSIVAFWLEEFQRSGPIEFNSLIS